MATVAQVAKASLQAILVQASEAPLEADEYQDFIFAMNNYMASLAAKGVNLGYTNVSTLADSVTVPPGAITVRRFALSYNRYGSFIRGTNH